MERVDVDDLPDEKPAPKKEKKKKKKRKKGVTVGKKFSNSLRDRRRRQAEALDYK